MKSMLYVSGALLLCGALACQPESTSSNTATGMDTQESCRGKCDGAIESPGELVDYTDQGTNTCSFAHESSRNVLSCKFIPPALPTGWNVSEVVVRSSNDAGTKTGSLRPDDFDGTFREISSYEDGSQYRFPVDVSSNVHVSNGRHTVSYVRTKQSLRWQERGEQETFSLGSPVMMREVMFWPSERLLELNRPLNLRIESEFPDTEEGVKVVPTGERTLVQTLTEEGDARQLIGATHAAPMVSGADPVVYAVVKGVEKRTVLKKPGHYLVLPDGTMRLTAPDALPTLSSELIDAYVTPCSACSSSEVCALDTCVERTAQSQSYSFVYGCEEPTASCDPGQNADCAEGHVCVEGLCRNLECQKQEWRCEEDNLAPCEVDSHCAEDHVCREGTCRDTSC